jgi:hypothetical protein
LDFSIPNTILGGCIVEMTIEVTIPAIPSPVEK